MKYTILRDLLPIFEQKMEKYMKKFKNYGTFSYLKSNTYICEDKNSNYYGHWLVDLDVTAAYKIGGYEFVAALEWIDEAKENLIKKISNDVYVPEIYKTRRECDHCKTKRLRKATIILKNIQTEEYIQVGKSCVKDYIGYDLGNYAAYLTFFVDLESYLASCEIDTLAKIRPQYNLVEVLEQTFAEVNAHGYISKAKAIECDCDSTAYKICSMFFGVKDVYTGDLIYPKYTSFDLTVKEEISNLFDFYKNYQPEEKNDYVDNIKTILKTDWIDSNNIGLVVSSIGTKLRIEAEKQSLAEKIKSDYIGKVGDKIRFIAKPECLFSADSAYGYYHIYRMSVNGNEVIWKTTKQLEKNVNLEFIATIKAHSDYKGVKQTEITRAKTKLVG